VRGNDFPVNGRNGQVNGQRSEPVRKISWFDKC
jgi:hypothetical protein